MSVDEPAGTTFTELYRDAHREYPTLVEFCLGASLVLVLGPVSRAFAQGWSTFLAATGLMGSGTLHEYAVIVGGPFALYFGGFVGVAYAYLRYRGRAEHVVPAVPDRRDLRWVGALALGAVVLLVAGKLAAEVLFDVSLSGVAPVGGEGSLDTVFLLFLINSTFIGIGREALFRGAIQGTLRDVTSARVAVGLTTLLFVAFGLGLSITFGLGLSMPTVPELVVYGTSIAVLSLALGYAMERTENVLVPMAGHATFQMVLFALVILGGW